MASVRFECTRRTDPPMLPRGATRLPVSTPEARDHLGWSLYWGEECINAIVAYVEHGNPLDQEHAVRTARAMWARVCRAKKYTYWDPRTREER